MVIEGLDDNIAIMAGVILVFAVIGFVSFMKFFFNSVKRTFKHKKPTEDTLKQESTPLPQRPQSYYSQRYIHTTPKDWDEPTKPQRQVRSFVDPID